MKYHHFLGISMTITRYHQFLQSLEDREEKTLIFTPNPEIFVRARRDETFREILKQATYNVPDGVGLYL
jgi:N-acetylglucosaminyldiphosphoundecaprenol N-acetyl-beta-D-mannosaminyltransferase